MPAPPTWPTQGLRRAGLRTMRGRRTRGTGRGGWRCCLRLGAARRASGGRGFGGTARGRVRGRRRPWMRSLGAAIRGCRVLVRSLVVLVVVVEDAEVASDAVGVLAGLLGGFVAAFLLGRHHKSLTCRYGWVQTVDTHRRKGTT